jgi:energy-coupling factor transporter ATP-binding protein EcfA2
MDDLYAWAREASYRFELPPVRALAESLARALSGAGAAAADAIRERFDVAGTSVEGLAKRLSAAVVPATGRAAPETGAGDRAGTASSPGAGEPALRFDGAGFGCGEYRVFDALDLRVARGEVVGIAGANASGKSTLLLLAARVHRPDAGRVTATFGKPFLLPQTPEGLFFAETVEEELAFGLRRASVGAAARAARSREAVTGAGLDPDDILGRFPFHLSLGEMRRVAFAMAVSLEPDLLLLDEPTSCLDPDGIEALRELVRRERSRGTTVLVASHDVSLLCAICDRVVMLEAGHVGADISVRDGVIDESAVWPTGRAPLIVELQSALAARGVRVWPHAADPVALAARLAPAR